MSLNNVLGANEGPYRPICMDGGISTRSAGAALQIVKGVHFYDIIVVIKKAEAFISHANRGQAVILIGSAGSNTA